MKLMPGLTVESGIDKSIIEGTIWVGKTGLEGDEHDLTFHGGPTKAVHACTPSISSADSPSINPSHTSLES
jgi:MOSC domain-containing protein YiiM